MSFHNLEDLEEEENTALQVPDSWIYYSVIVFLMVLILMLSIFILSKIGLKTHEHVRDNKKPEKIIFQGIR